MKCINFDERFADFTAKWMKEHRGEYKTYDENFCLSISFYY